MNRSSHKGKGKGNDPRRREQFDDLGDDRSTTQYRPDDHMDIGEDYDDPKGYRHSDRSYRRGVRREEYRSQDWSDRSGDYREASSDTLIGQYIATTDIEWEVISSDIQIYLGPEATVERVPDPEDNRRYAYLVKAKHNSLTQHMLSDLKADSLAWRHQERSAHIQGYTTTTTHRERQKTGPSRRLPIASPAVPRLDTYDRLRPESTQSGGAGFTIADSYAMGSPPPSQGNTFASSMGQSRHTSATRPQDRSFLTREEAEQIIARRLREVGGGVTRSQFEQLIDQALGQVSQAQGQILTREQAQRIITQRLKEAGTTTVTRSQLDDLVNNEIEESKQQNIDRVVDEAIQKGQNWPTTIQGRHATQAAPGNRPPPRQPSPDDPPRQSSSGGTFDQASSQVSQAQDQILTREQAQRIIAQRLKEAGTTSITRSQLDELVNQQIEKSKQQNMIDETIQKGQNRPSANQGRHATQAAPGIRHPPRQPSPEGTFGAKGPGYRPT